MAENDNIRRLQIVRAIGGGGPTDNDRMEQRVAALEEFATATRERLARIEASMATKEDVASLRTEMHKAIGDQTWKVIGWVTGAAAMLTAAVFFIARSVH